MDDSKLFPDTQPADTIPAWVRDLPFDPSHGHDLQSLLQIEAGTAPADFAAFWQARHARAQAVQPQSQLSATGVEKAGRREYLWHHRSTDGITVSGWALLPTSAPATRALFISHGYGGRTAPDFDFPAPPDTALFYGCARGLGRSAQPPFSSDPAWHVLHNVQNRDTYVIGGCVEDIWTGITALLIHVPQAKGRVGYAGVSFGGGIGALALPWDARIRRAYWKVPTFGHQRLRLHLPSYGSARSVQHFHQRHPAVTHTLDYFDAAFAARFARQPVLCACALNDPSVAPAGQFAIYNALPPEQRHLFVLPAGHMPHPGQQAAETELKQEVYNFFHDF